MKLRNTFAKTLATIDAAIVTSQQFKFDVFINKYDKLCWFAVDNGDVVPSLYVNMVDKALSELSPSHKGKYIEAYRQAVNLHMYEKNASEVKEDGSLLEFKSEEEWLAYMMQYEAESAYSDYSSRTFALVATLSDYKSYRYDTEPGLLKVVNNEFIEACHSIETFGDLVKWNVKLGDRYYQFIGSRNLSVDEITQIVYPKPH